MRGSKYTRRYAAVGVFFPLILGRACALWGEGCVNWCLSGPEGRTQCPYELSELVESSKSGNLVPDSEDEQDPGVVTQPISSELSTTRSKDQVNKLRGGYEAERGGGDATSEDEADPSGAQPWWSSPRNRDDLYSEHNRGRSQGRSRGFNRPGTVTDEWGTPLTSVREVEGGRWSESISAVKGSFRRLLGAGDRSGGQTRGLHQGQGQGYANRARRGHLPERDWRDDAGSAGGYYEQGSRDRTMGSGRRSEKGSLEEGGRGLERPEGDAVGMNQWESGESQTMQQHQFYPPPQRNQPEEQQGPWEVQRGVGGSSPPPPQLSPSRYDQKDPSEGFHVDGRQEVVQGFSNAGGVETGAGADPRTGAEISAQGSFHGVARGEYPKSAMGEGMPYPLPDGYSFPPPPPPPPQALQQQQPPSSPLSLVAGATHDNPVWEGQEGSMSREGGGGIDGANVWIDRKGGVGVGEAGRGVVRDGPTGKTEKRLGDEGGSHGGLHPDEVAAFYASQTGYGDGGTENSPLGGRGEGLTFGKSDADRPGWADKVEGADAWGDVDGQGQDKEGRGGWRGRGERVSGRISVKSLRGHYNLENWDDEEEGPVVISALHNTWDGVVRTGGMLASLCAAPWMAFSVPLSTLRVLACASGAAPLFLWLLLSVGRGVAPVVVAYLAARLVSCTALLSTGRYVLRAASVVDMRHDCIVLAAQQAGVGIALTAATGIVRGWLQPRAKERSAALSCRALAEACVAGIGDPPRPAEVGELSMAPWLYGCELMRLTEALGRLVATVVAMQLLWPGDGARAVAGCAASVLLLEAVVQFLRPRQGKLQSMLSPVIGYIEGLLQRNGGGSDVERLEVDARQLSQVLLEQHSKLLRDGMGEVGDRSVVSALSLLKGGLWWGLLGAMVLSGLLVVVQMEIQGMLTSGGLMLGMAQVWLIYTGLFKGLRSLDQLKALSPSASRVEDILLSHQAREGWKGAEDVRRGSAETGSGWKSDGPEPLDGLRLDGVTFKYAGHEMPALSGVSLHAPAGSVVAVLGGQGAGKTTLVRLILGLLPRSEGGGMVSFQGRPIEEWDMASYRERIAWINQVSPRFQLSAGENIGVGDAEQFSNQEMWFRAAGLGGASEAIEALPMGYDTLLEGLSMGSNFGNAHSSGLSEGEWQSLILSRFFMRADVARLLVLDEPFACQHPAVARRMMSMLGTQARATGQVVFVATQDHSLGRWADVVVLMESGRVVVAGPPYDLLSVPGGPYTRALQAYHVF